MKKHILTCLVIFLQFGLYAQTIEEKIDYTYENFNNKNFSNSNKYLNEIEVYLIKYKFDYQSILDFYDLAINNYYFLNDLNKSIEFAEKKRKYIGTITEVQNLDSLILSSDIILFDFNQENSNIEAATSCLKNILEISRYKDGIFLQTYNFYSLLNIDNYLEELDYVKGINYLKELETYNLLYYNSNSIDMVEIYLKLGLNYMETSNFELAENYLKKTNEINENSKSKNSLNAIQTAICLGSLYRRLGDDVLALDYYEKAEKNGENVFIENPLLLSNLLQNKANILKYYEDYKEVETLYLKVLKIRQEELGENHFEYVKALINLGKFYHSIGDFQIAESYLKKSEESLKSNYGENFIQLTSAKDGLASLNIDLDNHKKALELYFEEQSIFEFNNLNKNYEFAMLKSSLAHYYYSLRNYKNAILEFEKSIDLYKELFPENHYYVIEEKLELAKLYKEIGNFSEAKTIIKSILLDSISNNFQIENYFDGNFLLNEINQQEGFKKVSYKNQLSLLKKVEKSDLIESERHLNLLKKLASTEIDNNDFENAKKRLIYISSINKKKFGLNHTKVAESYHSLAQIYIRMNNLDSAEFYLKKTYDIQLNVFGQNHAKTSEVLKDLAYLNLKKGNIEKSDNQFKQYLNIEQNNYLKNYLVLNETGMLEYKNKIENTTRFYLDSRIQKNNPIISSDVFDLYDCWQSNNGINYSFNLKIRKLVEESNDPSIINTYNYIKQEMAKRTKWVEMTNLVRNNLKCNIDSLDNSILKLERKLYESLKLEKYEINPVSKDQIISLLDSNSVYINISEINFSSGHYLFSIYSKNSGQNKLIKFKIDSDKIKEINQKDEINNKLLYDLLWSNIDIYTDQINKINISADGIYSQLNISAFYNSKNNRYLFQDKDIYIFNNIKSFLYLKPDKNKKYYEKNASLYGFPDFNGKTSLSIDTSDYIASSRDLSKNLIDSLTRGNMKASPLPATKIEIEKITSILKKNGWNVLSYSQSEATEKNFKNEKSPRVLHIATHGYFFEDIPLDTTSNSFFGMDRDQMIQDPMLRSGLLFTGANGTLRGETSIGENGLLSAAEASLLDLKETELVVLSACETGKGEVKNGEGVYGLRKSIADAGAKNIIMSLWKVDDKVTQEFMSTFYENWLSGTTIREAFTKTQHFIKDKYPQPYYWGAFVLIGE